MSLESGKNFFRPLVSSVFAASTDELAGENRRCGVRLPRRFDAPESVRGFTESAQAGGVERSGNRFVFGMRRQRYLEIRALFIEAEARVRGAVGLHRIEYLQKAGKPFFR